MLADDFRSKKSRRVYLIIGLLLLAFFVGVYFGGQGLRVGGSADNFIFVDRGREQAPREVDWQLLWDAIDKINEKYVDRPADMLQVLYGAVSGAVASLEDPYSIFLQPKEAEDFQDELKGELEGIGAEIAVKNQRLTVVAPLDGSPAQRAGLRAGDFIYKVDGEETRDFTIEEAVKRIRGPAGSRVVLTVFHVGDLDESEIAVVRERIVVKSIESEIKEARGKRVGYVKMRRFGQESQGLLEGVISQFLSANVDGIIMDVRNNPGGFLEAAVEVAGNWVKEGMPVVIQKFGDSTEEVFPARGRTPLNQIPTVVLINGGSASASEIVAGALRDYGLATLVGEKTFGKGSVQELINLRGGADLKLTIAKWLTPSGHDLNKEGLEPDVKVELSDEDFNADRDPQLDTALEILVK